MTPNEAWEDMDAARWSAKELGQMDIYYALSAWLDGLDIYY